MYRTSSSPRRAATAIASEFLGTFFTRVPLGWRRKYHVDGDTALPARRRALHHNRYQGMRVCEASISRNRLNKVKTHRECTYEI